MSKQFQLTERRVRVHATMLAIGLWTSALVNLSSPGLMARNGHPKGEDFLQFWTMARLVHIGEAARLYDPTAHHALTARELPEASEFRYLPVYGPQVALLVSPLGRLPYLSAWVLWTALMTVLYAGSVFVVWLKCARLRDRPASVVLLALAFPPFWYLLMNGQSSAIVLVAFISMWLLLEGGMRFAGGLVLGVVFYKPQLGIAAAVTFVLLGDWRVVAGALSSAAAQVGAAYWAFGASALKGYAALVGTLPSITPLLQPNLSQMHSFRAFFQLLVPGSWLATAGYALAAVVGLLMCAKTWRRTGPHRLAFAELLLTTVLVSPHLFVYDLVLLGPAILLVEDWARTQPELPEMRRVHWLVYMLYAFPLLGPLAEYTRLQLSVLAVATLAWSVYELAWTVPRRQGLTT